MKKCLGIRHYIEILNSNPNFQMTVTEFLHNFFMKWFQSYQSNMKAEKKDILIWSISKMNKRVSYALFLRKVLDVL